MQSHEKEVIKTVVRTGQKNNAHFMYKCESWMSFGLKLSLMRCDRWRHVSHMPNMHVFTFHGRWTRFRAHLSSIGIRFFGGFAHGLIIDNFHLF